MAPTQEYRDPLYGFIEVDELEQRIIDTHAFQRLRGIVQLGTTPLVYPSGHHTRFEHALGTMDTSSELYDRLTRRQDTLDILGWNKTTLDFNRRVLRLAALLHDIGHAPFSHATEELFPGSKLHEDYSYDLITGSELGDLISHELGNDSKERVAGIAIGKTRHQEDSFLSELLAGDIGTDRVDYLARDSHHLGVAYGRFDRHRLFNTLRVRHNETTQGPELAITEGGLHAVEGFLLARYFMFVDVYFHRTRRILDTHLTEFIRDLLPGNTYPATVEEFLMWDDAAILRALQKRRSDPMARRVIAREFFRECFSTVDHPERAELVGFRLLSKAIRAEFGDDNLRFDSAEKTPYRYDTPPILVSTSAGFSSLVDCSPLIYNLNRIRKNRIYVRSDLRQEAQTFCQEWWKTNVDDIPGR